MQSNANVCIVMHCVFFFFSSEEKSIFYYGLPGLTGLSSQHFLFDLMTILLVGWAIRTLFDTAANLLNVYMPYPHPMFWLRLFLQVYVMTEYVTGYCHFKRNPHNE